MSTTNKLTYLSLCRNIESTKIQTVRDCSVALAILKLNIDKLAITYSFTYTPLNIQLDDDEVSTLEHAIKKDPLSKAKDIQRWMLG